MKRLLLALLLAVPMSIGSTIRLAEQRAAEPTAPPIRVMAFADSTGYFPVRFEADLEKAGASLTLVIAKNEKPRAVFYRDQQKLGEIPLQKGDGKFAENQRAVLDWLAKADKPDAPPDKKPDAPKYQRGRVADPAKTKAWHEAAKLRHNGRMQVLPTATAADFDARTMGWVGPVLDQGSCGSCWCVSHDDVCTAAFFKAGVYKADGSFLLSCQYIMDGCGGQTGGCGGDDGPTVLDMCKSKGLPTTADYGPYTAQAGRCHYKNEKLYQIADWGFASGDQQMGQATVQQIKNAIAAYGQVGTAVSADGWDSYQSGVFRGRSSNIDHDVSLIGWHDDTTMTEGGYWILKNQWGDSWGEKGYMRIAYGANSVGTEAAWVTVSALPPIPPQPPNPPNPPNPPGPGPYATVTIAAPGDYWLVPVPLTDADRMQLIRAIFAVPQGAKKP